MTDTPDLVAWLHEQIAEDERIARAVQWDGSGNRLSWELPASATIDAGEDEFYAGDRTIANHVVAWDPARVLRTVEAKRQLLVEHAGTENYVYTDDGTPACSTCGDSTIRFPCRTVRILAAEYADRDGYREEWRP